MSVPTEYMSFKHRWTRCSSNDFQVHQQHSQRKFWIFQPALLLFEALPGLSPELPDLPLLLPDLLLALAGLLPAPTGAPKIVLGVPRLLAGAPKCTKSSLWCLEVFPHLSQSLPWYSYNSLQRSQLLCRLGGIVSLALILSSHWRI